MHAITHLIYTGKDHGEEANRGASSRLSSYAEISRSSGLPEEVPSVLPGVLRGAGSHEGRSDCAGAMGCKRCGGKMKRGIAIAQTVTGCPDFAGGPVVTMSLGGTGRLIRCWKCMSCGWSVA